MRWLLLASLLACGGQAARPRAAPTRTVTSNLWREDYAGSDECRYCHASIYASWERSPMRRMTRVLPGAEVRAPFDGAELTLGPDRATVFTLGGRRFLRVDSVAGGERLFRLTRVIGGRTREDYAGVEVTGAADPVTAAGQGNELVLPVSYVYGTASFRYKGYSVLLRERPRMGVGPVWSRACIPCHNTLPYGDLLLDDLHGPGSRGFQGSMSDDLLPAPQLWQPRLLDEGGLRAELAREVAFLGAARLPEGASLAQILEGTMAALRGRLDGEHLVETGVGCEACHGGARAHVDDPRLRPSFVPVSPLVSVQPSGPPPSRAQTINHVCARCHTVLFSQYPHTWEGGRRKDPVPGGSSINSGEARDFLLGGCSAQLACTACHDPHTRDAPERLHAMGTPAGNGLCTSCHTELAGDAAVAAHSHHRAGGEGGACIACHMPRKNMGLDYELTRYHRIGSPTDPERVTRDRPLECALCHTDKTVAELVGAMERWWGKQYDRAPLRVLYGSLEANVLEATLRRGKPHEQGAAIGALGEARVAAAVPWIAPQLAHPIPLVRFFARRALEKITGAPVELDVGRPAAELLPEIARWLSSRG